MKTLSCFIILASAFLFQACKKEATPQEITSWETTISDNIKACYTHNRKGIKETTTLSDQNIDLVIATSSVDYHSTLETVEVIKYQKDKVTLKATIYRKPVTDGELDSREIREIELTKVKDKWKISESTPLHYIDVEE